MHFKRGKGAEKRGQVTIFIIIAIVLIVGILLYVFLSGSLNKETVSTKFDPVENYLLDCIKVSTSAGISLLEQGGGYIYNPEFVPGNDYNPSSSQLNFFGSGIPFWYYFQGKNIIREQVPAKIKMQDQLNRYISENMVCDLSSFIARGYNVNLSKLTFKTEILDNSVKVAVTGDLKLAFENESVVINKHDVEVTTKLGKFYKLALKIYNSEKNSSFIEDYALDVLHLYAPLTGTELTCAPKVWMFSQVSAELKNALEANMLMLKLKGNYYTLANEKNKYFVKNIVSDEAVRFFYDQKWPTKITVDPVDNGVMSAEPIGNQQGLGILGFCYVPYHFIYDVNYPLLIQIYDSNEFFQFPIVVSIENNQKRTGIYGESPLNESEPLCAYKNSPITVYTYDSHLNPVEASIKFSCLGQECSSGNTKTEDKFASATLNMPKCVNGEVIATAEGYMAGNSRISTNSESEVEIMLKKLYSMPLSLRVNGQEITDRALIYFKGEYGQTISWPEQNNITLAEGMYNITIFIYKNDSIKIAGSTSQKCVQVAKPGLMGLFGGTNEKCFTMSIPSQEISNVIIGGGKSEWYFSESELSEGKKMLIDTEKISTPKTLEELQNAYNLIENNNIDISFNNN